MSKVKIGPIKPEEMSPEELELYIDTLEVAAQNPMKLVVGSRVEENKEETHKQIDVIDV